jgi:glycosyltransferase involved in cell wall biosynthesis
MLFAASGCASSFFCTDTHRVSMTNSKSAAPAIKQPSILFACGSNILDITSGAALSMRTLLASLAAGGFRAVALQGTVFDSPQGGEHVIKAGEDHKDKAFLRANVLGVEHIIVRTKATYRPLMTCGEQEIFLRRFREEIRDRRPDMIITWGGMLLEMTMMREAREAGIPVVFYLVNGGYKDIDTFKHVSIVITDTEATAKLYKERLNLICQPVGKFIDISLVKAPSRKPEFITFINPSFEKGVNVVMPLAALAAKEAPHVKFLVVQSRGRWGNAAKVLGYTAEDFPNVKVIGHQRDMRGVYASTRALLLPSTWHESGARVIPEALLNGIPILASNSGGSPELIGKAGRIFDLPEAVREKRQERAPEEVVRPWLDEIRRIVDDEPYYNTLCEAAAGEAPKHDLKVSTGRFVAAVSPHVLASQRRMEHASEPTPTPSLLQTALEKKQAKQNRQSAQPRRKRA